MAISELDRKRIDVWCAAQTATVRSNEVRIDATYRGNSVTIAECRLPYHPSQGTEWLRSRIAKLVWSPTLNSWKLWAPGPSDRLMDYSARFEVGSTLVDLLEEIRQDPADVFWG
ncbi:DUF3024 domain-containing protein [Homoserinimonas sp. OAct 916]|uniref:DUF3024 domain-containing protein n=1 Tax=Homoserinimonas sp. OAct 916 TaxID=2211450 RepID=UPI001300406C|nr:DUF3024 domain-containing protein [Homoserinimonas sp. OAct 916]